MNEIDGSRPGARPLEAFGTLEELDCRGRRVFVRIDPYLIDTFDEDAARPPSAASRSAAAETRGAASPAPSSAEVGEPLAPSAATPDTSPTAASIPNEPAPAATLKRLLELEARLIVATHFDAEARLETGVDGVEDLATRLSERLGVEVLMPDEPVGDASLRVIHELRQGQVCVLPDLTTARGGVEQKNDEGFARALATSVDAYVFDAFSASHLTYASTVKLPRLLSRRALGQHARRELLGLSQLFALSRGSVGLLLGGRSFSDKVDALASWLPRVDRLCIGGGVAMTLLAAAGRARPDALAEQSRLAQARSLLARARDLGVTVSLPLDLRVQLAGDQGTLVKRPADVPPGARIVDIGPESAALFSEVLGKAKHLLWWGPLGDPRHPEGTEASRKLAEVCARPELMSVVLGGDTRRFVRQLPPQLQGGLDLVTTGSAAARALLTGRRLPAIDAVRLRR